MKSNLMLSLSVSIRAPSVAKQSAPIGISMSEASKTTPAPETQKQRWVKYGANVVLASVVVVLLAIVLTYLAQRANARVDTTHAGLYSLKPQTVNIIRDNKQKLKLVSLYAPVQGARTEAERKAAEEHATRMGVVADLLREYEHKGKNIDRKSTRL